MSDYFYINFDQADEINIGPTFFIEDWDEFFKDTKHCFTRKDYEKVRPIFTKKTLKAIKKQYKNSLKLLYKGVDLWWARNDPERYKQWLLECLRLIQDALLIKKARLRIV